MSYKATYIKAMQKGELPEEFTDGFNFGVACDKLTQLTIKSLVITEYENEPIVPTIKIENKFDKLFSNRTQRSTLIDCIDVLEPAIKNELLKVDEYLMNGKKKTLKFKRKIEGSYPYSRITYVSPWGFRYKVIISDTYVWHDINWISYNTKRDQEKYGGFKKADYTIETLNKLAETSLDFAKEIFYRINECTLCTGRSGCTNISIYEFNGQKKKRLWLE